MKKVYLEITNICNLDCSFCHGTLREKRMMTEQEYDFLTDALRGKAEYLYFHLMGEPLLHPGLTDFIMTARRKGFKPCITTNGTLLADRGEELAETAPYRVSISLHAPEANGAFATEEYLSACFRFARLAANKGNFTAFRLWNEGGLDSGNADILERLKEEFGERWVETRSGFRVADRIFVEFGELFDWPDLEANRYEGEIFCHGLRDQIGVLVDGTVVPCCLDAEGKIPLGNLFETGLEDIINSPRAKALYDSFTRHAPTEELCRRCGYAALKKMH